MTGTKAGKFLRGKIAALIAIIIVVGAIFTIANKSYISPKNIMSLMTSISLSGTLAVGLGCLLISGHVDLASGTEGCIAGIVVALLLGTGMPWPVALLLTVVFGCVMGLVHAFLVHVLGFMAFIATIGMSSVYKGLALVISNGANVSISNQAFYTIGSGSLGIFPLPFIIMTVLFIVYSLILKYTKFGRAVYLCGGNVNAARLAGVSPKRVSTILFVNCGAISALAGAIFAARVHMGGPNNVWGAEMDGIAAAVLGGVSFMGGSGNLGGAFVGLILINAFNNGLNAIGLQAYWQTAAQGVILIAALLVDYFGERGRVRALKAAS
ncbi:MAG: ABC transporter permease [Oscillospiraceae bacterium]|jgi:ribose/xylose/arabinose/galactoside ABC-type transport system permease subunit|nr:ABC transporter permease [Oscillospiraceae bacterium]